MFDAPEKIPSAGSSSTEESSQEEDYVEFLHAKIDSLDSQLTAALSRAKNSEGTLEDVQEENDTCLAELEIEVAHWRQRAQEATAAYESQQETMHKLRLEVVMLRKSSAHLREEQQRYKLRHESQRRKRKGVKAGLVRMGKAVDALEPLLRVRHAREENNVLEYNKGALSKLSRQREIQHSLQQEVRKCLAMLADSHGRLAIKEGGRIEGKSPDKPVVAALTGNVLRYGKTSEDEETKFEGGKDIRRESGLQLNRKEEPCKECKNLKVVEDDLVLLQLEKQKYMVNSLKAVVEQQRCELRKTQQSQEESLRELGSIKLEKEVLTKMLEETKEELDFHKKSSDQVSTEVGWLESKLESSAESIKLLKEELVLNKDILEEKSKELERLGGSENDFLARIARLNDELAKWKSKYSRLHTWRGNAIDQIKKWKQLIYDFTVDKPTQSEKIIQNSLQKIEKDHLSFVDTIESKLM